MKKSYLRKYAELIVRSGIAVKKGQYVVISANLDQEAFVLLVQDECYKAGAKDVIIRWGSEKAGKARLRKASLKALTSVLPEQIARAKWEADELPCFLWIESDDPDGMKGTNPAKRAAVAKAYWEALHEYREKRENKYQWCIAGAPSKAWAKKVFPGLSASQAVEKLWEAILKTSRAYEGDPIENWKKHDEDLKKRCDYLNSLKLKELHYTSKNGTDLRVGLIPGVIFLGGGEKTLGGIFYQPNIPSEECFTSPMKGKAEGIVYSAKPLSYNGALIENFWVKFHEGKAVDVHAEKGEEHLRSILTLDEGSAYLGECALVPFDSPINNTGLLFYSTLYDENAACHLALGAGFTNLYPNFDKYTEDEIHSFGINKSMSHVDFMIGSEDLSIVGTTEDGTEVQIFQNGNWAF